MKFKMFTGKTVASASFDAGGMLAGGLLSSGVEGLVPIEDSKMRKAALAALGIFGAASIQGNDTTAKITRNLLLGMGIRQGQRFIAEAATPTLPEADGTTMNKFMHDMLETGGGDVIKPTVEASRRMGMGYRFTPNRTNTQIGAHQTTAQPTRLEFPLT
ncbi:hypothetical protein C8N46_1212 [Kordia periserrulae]|uniref:Uncharacterized protein n=1 Tax=Kordia periserrulae TaxID=701523 RepID=A0A2T6BGT7_9FLAO|nr:hypothetical protein [Kordia periserrulae]PTX55285.1 hypothetical protein C8N46_1212 [Kordia periserrulae]